MEYTNKQVEEIIKENTFLKTQVNKWKVIAEDRQDEINELYDANEKTENICIENYQDVLRLEKTIKEKENEINHLKEMYKLVGDKNKTYKAVMKKYKEDNEEYNESVGIINVMVKEYDDIKLNRNRIVTKYQKKNNKLKETIIDIEKEKKVRDFKIKQVCGYLWGHYNADEINGFDSLCILTLNIRRILSDSMDKHREEFCSESSSDED
jgi:hypothetical protein